jgi:hypothetical protein
MSTSVSAVASTPQSSGSPHYGDKANIIKASHYDDAANDPPITLSNALLPSQSIHHIAALATLPEAGRDTNADSDHANW